MITISRDILQSIPHALFDPENEACGFLVGHNKLPGDEIIITDLWPVPSLRPSPDSYRIGRQQWNAARERAAHSGLSIVGTIHSHPDGPAGPSPRDLEIARRLRDEIRAVWHPRSGTLTVYGARGIISQQSVRQPLWMRLLAMLLFV